jgi:hypothetical protein
MARYKMTVVFDVNEAIEMKHRVVETIVRDIDMGKFEYKVVKTAENYDDRQPHINKLYEDVLERIETSPKHPITYDIVSFEKLKEE